MLRPEETRRPLSVSELAQEIQRELRPLFQVFVKGEVSGMKQSAKGHYNFTIRDAASKIDAFLFASDARRLAMLPEDGQEFIFRGRVDYWAEGGKIRLVVDQVEFDDAGKLRAQLEHLKRRLELEGAFNPARKRPIPFIPKRIALITSPTGAVIHDLQQTIWDRWPQMDIAVYPAQVQGTASPASVAAALAHCNRDGDASVVVIARGGGSFEELYAFNTEPVARAILASLIPVVTALGHTSDRTVADMVADAECRTPTEAGARVVPVRADLVAQMADRERRLKRELGLRIRAAADALGARSERLRQVVPALVRARSERLGRCLEQLARLSPGELLDRRQEALAGRSERLLRAALEAPVRRAVQLAALRADERVERGAAARLQSALEGLGQRERRLEAISPDAVLNRGYSITQDAGSGQVLREAAETAAGKRILVRLARGRIEAEVGGVEV